MKVLIADDEKVSRKLLEGTLTKLGYDVNAAENGEQAWEALKAEDPPKLAILDWMMPGMEGIEVCRRVRELKRSTYIYIILLTSKAQKQDVVDGFKAGVDDYLVKPLDAQDLQSRLAVCRRILDLESTLGNKVEELEEAIKHVQQLQGLLPICMHCKKIRANDDSWHLIESYVAQHSEAQFTHSLCAECRAEHYPSPQKQNGAGDS
jgi:sigma-B regulation protein RsbU (phosphoserine phosphatase)